MKSEDLCFRLLPCLGVQPRFAAGLFKKLFAAKLVLDRNLRKQKPALCALDDQQTVFADLDVFGKNRLGRRQEGYLDVKVWKLVRAHGRKSRIVKRRAGGAPRDGLPEGSNASTTPMQPRKRPRA